MAHAISVAAKPVVVLGDRIEAWLPASADRTSGGVVFVVMVERPKQIDRQRCAFDLEDILEGMHTPEEFEAFYAGTPPWDIGRPQSAFLRLAESGALEGRVLDVGCGTGEHALMAAGCGLEAVGVDTAPSAIAAAERKAHARGVPAKFLVWNALSLTSLGEEFDTVLDCGLFHVFSDEDRRSFVQNLTAVVRPVGRYFMLCFSEHQPGDTGPRRVTQAEIRANFADGWHIDSIQSATIEITAGPAVLAWLASIRRT
jgi:2-polyprenyl-3-methyl-5-hydroxy-6-metoxy-1,4-benzoquinol methylase